MQRLALLAPIAAIAAGEDNGGMLRASWHVRWLSDTEADIEEQKYIWGGCEAALEGQQGCALKDGLQCSSHLSEGPADGDVTLTLSNLPPSTNETDVHLAFWAARKSVYEYDAMRSPYGCAVYKDLRKAYPLFNETEDFNGGNVQVDENGTATIRIRQPAAYVVSKYVLMPHIHLRLCTGDSRASRSPDTIFFTRRGPAFVQGFHGHDHEAFVDSWTARENAGTTTPPPGTDGNVLDSTDGYVDFRVREARQELDLDALEFSPVYNCLLQGKFYSYFTSSCVTQCPVYAEVHVGQCVKKETSAAPQTMTAAWRLGLECGEHCFHDKLNVTMHHLRLTVGDKLDIPFQEVERATLALVSRRRLEPAGGAGIKKADMIVTVRSKRVDPTTDGPKLKSLLEGVNKASWLLGFTVHDVEALQATPTDDGDVIVAITDGSDPYAGAYDEAAKNNGLEVVPGAELPIWAVVTGSLLVFLAVASAGVFLWYRRKKAARELQGMPEVQGVPVFQGAPAAAPGAPVPTKGGDSSTMPSTVGAPSDDGPQKPSNFAGPSQAI